MNAFGFFILMFVAISSDFYRERSTHLGATLVGVLLIFVNLPLVFLPLPIVCSDHCLI